MCIRDSGKPGTPFWQRSGDILRYGLKPPAVWLILAVGAASVLPMGLLTGLLLLFLSLMLTVYALFVIAAVAADEWQPPSPLDVMSEGGLLLKQIALMVVLFVAFCSLRYNNIGAEGGKMIGEALKTNTTLHTLE